MFEIIRSEVVVSSRKDQETGDTFAALITHNIPTWDASGHAYLTEEENEAALKAAAQAFAAALPTDRGYKIVSSLVSEAKSAI